MDPPQPSLFDNLDDADALATAPPALTAAPSTGSAPRQRAPRAPTVTAPTLLAVDGDSLAHRAFHGYPTDRTPGPVHGFLALLVAVCDQVPVDGIVVGFDCRESSARRRRHPDYKGQRADKDAGLLALLLALPDALAELGMHVVNPDDWEADDVVASAAATAEAQGWRCAVATSDRDAYCVVSDRTTVLRLRGRGQINPITPQRLRREVRVAPEQYVEYAALRGDTSDNLPGVPGIGPTRAAALLAAYPSVDEAAADPIGCRSVLGRDVGQALLDDLASEDSVFRRNVDLMTPRRDIPVDLDAARRRPRAEHVGERLSAWGLGPLAARVGAAVSARPDRPPPPDEAPVPQDR